MLGHRAPDRAVLVQRQRAARSGPTDRAGTFLPLLAAAGGELSLGGAVELPRRPGGNVAISRSLTAAGHGASAWATRRNEDRSGMPTSSQSRRGAAGGSDAEHRGGPVRAIAAVTAAGSNGPRTTTEPPARSVPIAKRRGAEWWSGLSTRFTSVARKPHRSRSSATSPPPVARSAARCRRPGRPGRATGHVHRSGPRSCAAEALRVCLSIASSCPASPQQVRTRSREDPLALVRREARVEGIGNTPPPAGTSPGPRRASTRARAGRPRSLAQLDRVHGVDPRHRPWRGRIGAC